MEGRTRTSNFGLEIPEETFLFTHLEPERLRYSNSSHREGGWWWVCLRKVLSENVVGEKKKIEKAKGMINIVRCTYQIAGRHMDTTAES